MKNYFKKIIKNIHIFAKNPYVFLLRNEKIAQLLAWEGFYRFVVNGPNKFRYISQLYFFTYRDKNLRKRLMAELSNNPETAAFIQSRNRITRTLESLANCQKGTLGHAFYEHMTANKIKLVVPLDAKIQNDFQYVIHRILVTHDIYHALLNAKTDFYGESFVAAFTNSQINSYTPPVVHVSAGMLRCATVEPAILDIGNLGFVRGWLLGKKAKQFFCIDWDKYWDTPINEVRNELNVCLNEIELTIPYSNPYGQRLISSMPACIRDYLFNYICHTQEHEITIDHGHHKVNVFLKSYESTLKPPIATVILGRAMFTSGSYLADNKKNSLAACLIQKGFRVLIPSLNKEKLYIHENNFDEMIKNTAHYIDLAKKQWPENPVILVGHSLSGLSFLVQQGLTSSDHQVACIVTLGAATWNREYLKQESKLYQVKLNMTSYLLIAFLKTIGHVPAKLLKYGNFNENNEMIEQVILANVLRGEWQSKDKKFNYYKVLNNIHCPVLSVASKKDKYATVTQVASLHSNIKLKPEMLICDDLSHVGLASSPKAWEMWERVADWISNKVTMKE